MGVRIERVLQYVKIGVGEKVRRISLGLGEGGRAWSKIRVFQGI